MGGQTSTLNPMKFHPRFQHISEQTFEKLDNQSLKNCREVATSWQNCIDTQNILWKKIVKTKENNETFLFASENGHTKMVQMLIQRPVLFNIDPNTKNDNDMTAFHLACANGHSKVQVSSYYKSPIEIGLF